MRKLLTDFKMKSVIRKTIFCCIMLLSFIVVAGANIDKSAEAINKNSGQYQICKLKDTKSDGWIQIRVDGPGEYRIIMEGLKKNGKYQWVWEETFSYGWGYYAEVRKYRLGNDHKSYRITVKGPNGYKINGENNVSF